MSVYNDDQLYHVGVLGMKWGHHKTNFSSPNELQSWMKNNIKYSNFTKLKSPDEVMRSRNGSCHDQVMLELKELKKMGLKPKAKFLIEYQPGKSQGGTTHSFVYYQKNGKTYWLENAWIGQKGVHKFDNLNELTNKITNLHKTGKLGNVNKFSKLAWGEFKENEHKPGESLDTLVNTCLS